MGEKIPFLCEGCPAAGDHRVDLAVNGSCYIKTFDSFRQTRKYRIEYPDEYGSNEEMAKLSSDNLRYYDFENDEWLEQQGDIEAAQLGIECAERFLAGNCTKSKNQILRESEID